LQFFKAAGSIHGPHMGFPECFGYMAAECPSFCGKRNHAEQFQSLLQESSLQNLSLKQLRELALDALGSTALCGGYFPFADAKQDLRAKKQGQGYGSMRERPCIARHGSLLLHTSARTAK